MPSALGAPTTERARVSAAREAATGAATGAAEGAAKGAARHQAEDLVVEGLCKAFEPGRPVLDGIGFALARGEAVALIGANGTGKSTLLRCCLRLVEPDAGTVRLFDRDLSRLGRRALRRVRRDVGFVFQRHNLVPRLSALSNVVHGALGRVGGPRAWSQALAPKALRAEALDCLDRVGLADLALRRADRLSGGQSQRVAIARALMQRPRLVLADEPVASLDPRAGEEVMELFAGLLRREGLTLLFTAHNLDHALRYGDRVIGLHGGGLALDAPSESLAAADLRGLYG